MRTIIMLVCGLILASAVQAQVGSSISADGSAPNNNAMLDVKSPTSGDGKGMLIPRITVNQRTNASLSVEGGLLDNSGNLRGGAAQGLIVYQTDPSQGLYFNTSSSATPAWAYLGDINGLLASNVWASADSTTNYLPRTGGTMSGTLNMGAQAVTNVALIEFNGEEVAVGLGANALTQGSAVGKSANGSSYGAALGFSATATNFGVAIGRLANGSDSGQAIGFFANGYDNGVAIGRDANGTNFGVGVGFTANGSREGVAMGDVANGYNFGTAVGQLTKGTNYGAAMGASADGSSYGAAVGYQANGYNFGAAVGRQANGYYYGVAMGYLAVGTNRGAAVGRSANGVNDGVALGYLANGYYYGAAVGWSANGTNGGAALGTSANGSDSGAALGNLANGYYYGAAMGWSANGNSLGTALGYLAKGSNYGAAVGAYAIGVNSNVAIGARANASGGTQRIAIGNNVTNTVDGSVRIRGHLYLDGGTNILTNSAFGSSDWGIKAFAIDHPLDPQNKILRHFCLEGPQVWNVYAGNAQLVNGQAVIELPDYYSALNLVGSEIYGLTIVDESTDQFPLVKVVKKVADNGFVIAGTRDVKVSWTIKVLRNDSGCLEDLKRRPVEQRKSELDLPAVLRPALQAGTGN